MNYIDIFFFTYLKIDKSFESNVYMDYVRLGEVK